MNNTIRMYLILTFLIMGICWGTCLVCSLFGIFLTAMPVLYIPFLIGGWSPTIAAFWVMRKTNCVSGFKDWLSKTFDWKQSLWKYAAAVVFAAIFFCCLCAVSGYSVGAPLFAVVFMIPPMLFMGGLEEVGWRGLLQPELEKRLGFTLATLVVSLIWWLWHLPLFYINGVSQYGTDFLEFGINILGLSFALAALKKTTGSTWLCVFLHCLVNSLHGVYVIAPGRLGSAVAAAALIVASYVFRLIENRAMRNFH